MLRRHPQKPRGTILLRRIGLVAVAIGILIALLVSSLPAMIPLGLAIAGVDDVTFKTRLRWAFDRTRLGALVIGKPPRQRVASHRSRLQFVTGLASTGESIVSALMAW